MQITPEVFISMQARIEVYTKRNLLIKIEMI